MSICKKCKNNIKGYCKYYKTRVAVLGNLCSCTALKEIKDEISKTNNTKKKSIKQEKRLAKDWGAKRTPQSGAQDTSPSDLNKDSYVIESKATKNKSISLKKEWLDQLKASPINFGKIPLLVIEFDRKNRYVILDERDFKNIMEERNVVE